MKLLYSHAFLVRLRIKRRGGKEEQKNRHSSELSKSVTSTLIRDSASKYTLRNFSRNQNFNTGKETKRYTFIHIHRKEARVTTRSTDRLTKIHQYTQKYPIPQRLGKALDQSETLTHENFAGKTHRGNK